jgi:hypothetical protein
MRSVLSRGSRPLAVIVRIGLVAMALLNGWWGVWARFWPRSFFDVFPGLGHHWTAAYPPYNEHLVTDLGATFLTLAFLLALAAVVSDQRVRAVVLAGTIVFNALHLSFHLSHHEGMAAADTVASLTTLAVGVLGPIVLLGLDRRARPWPAGPGEAA